MIPNWMQEVNTEPCRCSAVYRGKKSFIGRTIEEIIEFMETTFFSEVYSRRKGLLQSLDPRIKLVSILTVIVATSFHQAGLAFHPHFCRHHRYTHDLQYLLTRRSSN